MELMKWEPETDNKAVQTVAKVTSGTINGIATTGEYVVIKPTKYVTKQVINITVNGDGLGITIIAMLFFAIIVFIYGWNVVVVK